MHSTEEGGGDKNFSTIFLFADYPELYPELYPEQHDNLLRTFCLVEVTRYSQVITR